ncbi:MAG: AgmX/PglI C-terminal domain-containing protein [Deltaproteobacteria bacterium]|nr:AgmX/PglI C-terminal domain-containing protein [Deltaproteobacteria bacterium]
MAQALRRNMGRFRACYMRELRRDPDIEGRLLLIFGIGPEGPEGRTERPRVVRNRTGSRRLATCVRRVLWHLRLPAASARARAVRRYSLDFRSERVRRRRRGRGFPEDF